MKTVLASLILTLAAYAQACCADDVTINLFKTHTVLSEYQQSQVQPTWLFGSGDSIQFMGFTQVTHTLTENERVPTTQQVMGFGLHQQITPFLFTQILMTEEKGGSSAVKVGMEF